MSTLVIMLDRCAEQFDRYATHHRGRCTPEHDIKAGVNEALAFEIRELLAQGEAREWRELHASLRHIHRKIDKMADDTQTAFDRLGASVTAIGAAVQRVSADIKNHPAATADAGKLNLLADQLDAAASALIGLATGMEANDAPAPAPEPAPEPAPPADPAPPAEPAAPVDQSTSSDPALSDQS